MLTIALGSIQNVLLIDWQMWGGRGGVQKQSWSSLGMTQARAAKGSHRRKPQKPLRFISDKVFSWTEGAFLLFFWGIAPRSVGGINQRAESGGSDPLWLALAFWGTPIVRPEVPKPFKISSLGPLDWKLGLAVLDHWCRLCCAVRVTTETQECVSQGCSCPSFYRFGLLDHAACSQHLHLCKVDRCLRWIQPWRRSVLQLTSDSVKRHLRGRHLSVLNLKFDFISDGGRTREEQIALSLKRHLFPHGGREPKAFWICFSRVHPPPEIKSNFKFKTLKRHLLKRRLTLSDDGALSLTAPY